MDVLKARSGRWFSNLPKRLYRALPSVTLGILFNLLDTVSAGLLIFPSDGGSSAFQAVQVQALSMYIMSTIMSQIAMTLGGSRFPGGIGAMLIEILPFLRGIATDIRHELGDNNPTLIPTVMAAYALTSFLTGAVFFVLGLLQLGNLVAYFPQTVLTGAIGAIGFSLFILGLGLPFPPSSPTLTLSNAKSTVFAPTHLPLLLATLLPALLLSISTRSRTLTRWTRGLVQHDYYVPVYLFSIPVIFWIAASAMHVSNETLVSHGWLFHVQVDTPLTPGKLSGTGFVSTWNYWSQFDFTQVEWGAMRKAIANIVLLVCIGVLNLPIFVPALAFTLDVSYDMNHEFFGQGAANLLAGLVGTVPNILQYSYSVFFTRAHGGRFEATLVIILTFVLFLTSGLLLPYVPTILASSLVLFIGFELLISSVWESAKTLVFLEWGIVVVTLVACTVLGFAEGFGVGMASAAGVYFVYGVVDSRARAVQWEEWNETHRQQRSSFDQHTADEESQHQNQTQLPHHSHPSEIPVELHVLSQVGPSALQRMSPLHLTPLTAAATQSADDESRGLVVNSDSDAESARACGQSRIRNSFKGNEAGNEKLEGSEDVLLRIRARVVVLTGYVFFATIPSLETQLLRNSSTGSGLNKTKTKFIIVDMSSVYRLETAAAQTLDHARRDLAPDTNGDDGGTILVLGGIMRKSGPHADFERAGVRLEFADSVLSLGMKGIKVDGEKGNKDENGDGDKDENRHKDKDKTQDSTGRGILAFKTCREAIAWCRYRHEYDLALARKVYESDKKLLSDEDVYQLFCAQFDFDSAKVLADGRHGLNSDSSEHDNLESTNPSLDRFTDAGAQIRCYDLGEPIALSGSSGNTDPRTVLIVNGDAEIIETTSIPSPSLQPTERPSLQRFLVMMPRESLVLIRDRVNSLLMNVARLGRRSSEQTQTVTGVTSRVVSQVCSGDVIHLTRGAGGQVIRVISRSPCCYTVEIGSDASEAIIRWAAGVGRGKDLDVQEWVSSKAVDKIRQVQA